MATMVSAMYAPSVIGLRLLHCLPAASQCTCCPPKAATTHCHSPSRLRPLHPLTLPSSWALTLCSSLGTAPPCTSCSFWEALPSTAPVALCPAPAPAPSPAFSATQPTCQML